MKSTTTTRSVRKLGLMAAAAALALAGCGSGASTGTTTATASGQAGMKVPDLKALDKLGESEGKISILAWPGYAEDGSNDPKVDWVTPFEKASGCDATIKTFGSSDEAVQLMRTGQYDVVSASGDATLRLIAAGDVSPVNTDLVPAYKDVWASLKDKPWNSVNGQMYGIPHGWGANLLMYNTEKSTPAPDSWGSVFDKVSAADKGHVTAYDSPIYIADAANYLKSAKPELGIKDPYALDDKQLAAAVDLLKTQKAAIGEYWNDYLKEIQAFKNGSTTIGTTWQVIASLAEAEGAPVKAILPKEGSTGWSDNWMISSKTKAPNCSYKWMDWMAAPEAQAAVAAYFGESPANPKACELIEDKTHCDTYHTTDQAFYDQIAFWTTPIPECLDGRTDVKCTDYATWTKAWTDIRNS